METKLDHIKESILRQLMEKVKESGGGLARLDESTIRRRIEGMFKSALKENKEILLTHQEQEEILGDIISYLLGLGPIDKLLKDPDVTEIMINGPKQVYIEKEGRLEIADITFRDEEHLMYFIERILAPLGRRATTFEPYVDARLNDGSRVNIVIYPVSPIGPILTIRKFSHRVLNIDDLINLGTLTEQVADFLNACVVSRLNILICGGASSGKTTLLNVLGSFIPDYERVITIEDTLELKLSRKHVIPLESRAPNIEGKGEITLRSLLRNALHMRPDRIIMGEVRSDEVLDMVQAMNIGHEGSMTTLHANSALEALDRLEVLALMGSANISSEVARRQIISALDLIINMTRFTDGSRKVTQVSAVVKSKEYQLQDIFIFEEKRLKSTGEIPPFYPKLKDKVNYICKEFER